jgi:fructose-1,6-bisphosphatase I
VSASKSLTSSPTTYWFKYCAGGRRGPRSEEEDDLLLVNTGSANDTRYTVLFDPLDGSSNLDVTGSVGTIFSIYQADCERADRLLPGREQIAEGYVLYGSSTVFVLTTGSGVHMFVLDPVIGAFIRVGESLRIPEFDKTYSTNEALSDGFPDAYRRFLKQRRAEEFSLRYAGAMVADVHRVLLNGGIFMYPAKAKSPTGKLRLIYEANPMAMIISQSGGIATTGECNILDVDPLTLHQRVPVVLGSPDNVADLFDCVAG